MLNIHEQILHVPKTDGNFLSVQHTSAPSIWRASRESARKLQYDMNCVKSVATQSVFRLVVKSTSYERRESAAYMLHNCANKEHR